MNMLIIGLLLFLGLHSIRAVADDWRTRMQLRWGAKAYKGVYALASALGLALIIWGYGLARTEPLWLWVAPLWTRHLSALLMLPALILLVAAYVPGNAIKARLHHPMLLSVKLWALAHLMSNGSVADLLLFGGFLGWAVLCFGAARRRDRAAAPVAPQAPASRLAATLATVVAGVLAWAGIAFWAHQALIGVRPIG